MTDLVVSPRTGWVADDATFGARLALIRQRMRWGNVKEAADACGVPVESWRRWERDGRAPRDVIQIAEQISGKVGCDYLWLLTGSTTGRRTPTRRLATPKRSPSSTRPSAGRPPSVSSAARRPQYVRSAA